MSKILLVEDNEMNRDMLSRRLVRRGYHVVIATDGEEGVRRAQHDAPDLVLMDMSLPVVDGWEATRRLKACAATRAIPVIALTAHAMSSDRERALAAGCDDFDTKPVEIDRLTAKIEALLRRGERDAPASVAVPHAAFADLAALRQFVADACSRERVEERAREDLELAVDEACTNVIEHGYAVGEPGPVALTVTRDGDALRVTITDHGTPFSPARAPEANTTADWQDRPEGGVGWHLIKRLTDGWEYETAPDGTESALTSSNTSREPTGWNTYLRPARRWRSRSTAAWA